MAAYVTRCGSDQNSETSQILPILDSLEQDLLVPYVEKRHKHENNPKVELQNAFSEITQREQDLKAAIGISKFLIRSNKDLLQKLKLSDEDKKELITKIKELETEITAEKNEVLSLQEKNYEITSSLDNTEDELERVSGDYHKLLREKSKNKVNMSLDSISLDRFSAEINDMTLKFREEYDLTLSNL
jgi:chromosome segregation ATPase